MIPRYHTLEKGAELTGFEVEEILELAERGEVVLCFIFRGLPGNPYAKWAWTQYDPEDGNKILGSGESYPHRVAIQLNRQDITRLARSDTMRFSGGRLFPERPEDERVHLHWYGPHEITSADLRIPGSEIKRMMGADGPEPLPDPEPPSLAPADHAVEAVPDLPPASTVRGQQCRAILKAIGAEGWDRMLVPDGGKAKVKRKLNQDWSANNWSFDEAWKVGSKAGYWRMANRNKYVAGAPEE